MKILLFRDLEIATPKILTDQICNFVNIFLIICGFFLKNITTFTAPKINIYSDYFQFCYLVLLSASIRNHKLKN